MTKAACATGSALSILQRSCNFAESMEDTEFFKVVDKAVIVTSGVGSLLLQDQELPSFSS